jgi:hypothetical protein
MHQLLFRPHALHPRVLIVLAVALVALVATAASAQAAPVRQIQLNAIKGPGGAKMVLEAQSNKLVKLVPAQSGNLRQQWVQESSSFGGATFRNLGVFNQCLRDTGPQSQNQNLQVGSCTDQLGGRQRWMLRTGSIANTGVQIQNVATSRVIVQYISDLTDFDVDVFTTSFGDAFPNSSEWRLPRIGDI